MNWLAVIWSMGSAACRVMAFLHLCLTGFGHQRRADLLVTTMGHGAGAVAMGEMLNMKATSPAAAVRTSMHSELFLTARVVSMPWFAQVRFGTGPPLRADRNRAGRVPL